MNRIQTPLGDIIVTIDDIEIDYVFSRAKKANPIFPNVMNRFQFRIDLPISQKDHVIKCFLKHSTQITKFYESGEHYECVSLYGENRIKLSIGVIGESWGYIDNVLESCQNDYNIDYLDNDISYLIYPTTKTTDYFFGIAWIDDVGYEDPISDKDHENRDTETWFAADPSIPL